MAEKKLPQVVGDECIVRADRQVFTSETDLAAALRELSDFRTERDHALRNAESPLFWTAYARVRRLINNQTRTRLFINYKPRYRRLASIRVAIVPDDFAGLRRPEFEMILRAFEPYRLTHVELAIDFPRNTR
jgi:hypothetical protein